MNGIEERVRASLRQRADSETAEANEAWERFADRFGPEHVRVEGPRSPRPRRLLVAALAVALSAGVTAVTILALRPAVIGPSPGEKLASFIAYMREAGPADYDPAPTPAALAKQVDAVVIGTIEGVEEGQSYAVPGDPRPAVATSVLRIQVTKLLTGDAGLMHEGSVYIEVGHPAYVGSGVPGGPEVPFDHAAYAKTVPVGSKGLFFLYDRTNEPYAEVILNEGAGRPAGARITQAFVQGFLIETESGKLVSVFASFETMPPAWHDLKSIEEVRERIE